MVAPLRPCPHSPRFPGKNVNLHIVLPANNTHQKELLTANLRPDSQPTCSAIPGQSTQRPASRRSAPLSAREGCHTRGVLFFFFSVLFFFAPPPLHPHYL